MSAGRKELREEIRRRALSCPCCGSLFLFGVTFFASPGLAEALGFVRREISNETVRLVPAEEAEELASAGTPLANWNTS